MQSPADRCPRAVRSAVFAVAAVTLAALAHALGHGPAARPSVLLISGATVFAGAEVAGGEERCFASIAGAMVAVQVGLHLVLTLGGILPLLHDGWGVVLPAALCLHRTTSTAMGVMGQSAGGSWWPMVGAHGVAALLLAWALRCGEASIWALAQRAVRCVRRRRSTRRPGGWPELSGRAARQLAWATRSARPVRGRRLRHCLVLRGPPALTAWGPSAWPPDHPSA